MILRKLLVLSGFIALCSFQGVQARLKNVLVLHSYNSGLSWTDRINQGIMESFHGDYHRTIDLRCEFMDAKHFESNNYFRSFEKYLAEKYANIPIDLVMCSDNAAFDFLTLYHTPLFGSAPVVFCGLNYCDSVPPGFTGIMEDIRLADNLKLITSVHPRYHKLYIINDRSITGKSITRELNRIIPKDFPNLRYEYLTDYTLSELQQKLTTLTPDDAVLMLLFNFDRSGATYSFDYILDELLPYCKAPVYGTWNFYMNKGIVGGKITDGYDQGFMASAISKEVLNGKNPSDIPVVAGPTRYMFDYKVLKQFHISRSSLPGPHEIINEPYDIVLRNKALFTLLGVIMLLLIVIICLLYWQMQKARKSLAIEQDLVSTIEEKSAEIEKALELAEQSSRLKSAFLANISHEIRTPMNGILGFSSLLKDCEDQQVQREYIRLIHHCGGQLLNIINDVLDISLVESGQITLHNEVVSLNGIIRDVCSVFNSHQHLENKTIHKSVCFADGDDYIVTDGAKLRQILAALLSNALKFSHQGDVVISYELKGSELEFFVKDEGIGIAPENHELIFERFRQVEQDNTKIYGGNGLGLSIAKAFVELLDGRIWVESALGKGSTFFFTIPCHKSTKPV